MRPGGLGSPSAPPRGYPSGLVTAQGASLLAASTAAAQRTVLGLGGLGGDRILAYLIGANSNLTGDQALTMVPFVGPVVTNRIIFANASVNLALSAMVGAVRTAAAAGGSAIASTLLTAGLTAATKYTTMPSLLTADLVSSTQWYLRNSVASAIVGTFDLYVIGDDLGLVT